MRGMRLVGYTTACIEVLAALTSMAKATYLYPRVVPTAGRVAESSSISAYRDVEHREILGQAGSGR
jgi:hypothetical protein